MRTCTHQSKSLKSLRLFLKVLEETKIKNSVLRGKCCQYLECVLKNYPKTILEKFTEDIEEPLASLLNEAAAETRATARECYLTYESIFPVEARNLLKQLPIPTQKAILEQSNKTNTPESKLATPERLGVKSPQDYGSEKLKSDFGAACGASTHRKRQATRTAFSSSKVINKQTEFITEPKKSLAKNIKEGRRESKQLEKVQFVSESVHSEEDKSTPGSILTEENRIAPENDQGEEVQGNSNVEDCNTLIAKVYSDVV